MTNRLTKQQLFDRLDALTELANIPPFKRTDEVLREILGVIFDLGASVYKAEQENEARLDPNLMLGLGLILGTAIKYARPQPQPGPEMQSDGSLSGEKPATWPRWAENKYRDWKEAERPRWEQKTNRYKGGLARAAALSPERRSEISRAAARARWSKP